MAWNKEQQRMYNKAYREANREKMAKYGAEYYARNRDKMAEYRRANNEKRKAQFKAWYAANKDYMNEYWRNKRANDVQYQIAANLRCRVRDRVRNAKSSKTESTMKLLGCSMTHFMEHISSKFQKDMSWDNYGEWHLDHIKPCAGFDLTKEEDQRKCFHYTNFQPLWAEDNISKQDKDYETWLVEQEQKGQTDGTQPTSAGRN